MKTVVLIGDSIRMGYCPVVERELQAVARIRAPAENGGDSNKVLANLEAWIGADADVIHINCGLHDIKREFGAACNQVPIEAYEHNVRAVLTRLTTDTSARIIWASTTPVNHDWHHEDKGFDRFDEDIVAYEAVARQIAAELGVVVNDLHTVVTEAGRDSMLLPDGVHYTPEGYALLGRAVAAFIRPYLM